MALMPAVNSSSVKVQTGRNWQAPVSVFLVASCHPISLFGTRQVIRSDQLATPCLFGTVLMFDPQESCEHVRSTSTWSEYLVRYSDKPTSTWSEYLQSSTQINLHPHGASTYSQVPR